MPKLYTRKLSWFCVRCYPLEDLKANKTLEFWQNIKYFIHTEIPPGQQGHVPDVEECPTCGFGRNGEKWMSYSEDVKEQVRDALREAGLPVCED